MDHRSVNLAMLKGLQAGALKPEDTFIQIHIFNGSNGLYEKHGKTHTQSELDKFRGENILANKRRTQCGIMKDTIAIIIE